MLEAIQAHSEGNKRILDDLAIIEAFPDSALAMRSYSQIHRVAPQCELYVFHTSRETLDIEERQWLVAPFGEGCQVLQVFQEVLEFIDGQRYGNPLALFLGG